MMKVYTKTGDKGETGLRGGKRVPKSHPRVAAYGEIDELNCAIGAAAAELPEGKAALALRRELERAQAELFQLGAALSCPPEHPEARAFPEGLERWQEAAIDRMTARLPELRNFILPGGSRPGAGLHLARAVCRRAERALLALPAGEFPPAAVVYLNRLSDYLFTAARWANRLARRRELEWMGKGVRP